MNCCKRGDCLACIIERLSLYIDITCGNDIIQYHANTRMADAITKHNKK